MHCPLDNFIMVSSTVDAFDIHRCTHCSGVFLPGNFFKEIRAHAALKAHQLKSRADDGASPPHSNGICCLNDGQPMMHLKFKGIEFAVCSSCFSLWLDQGKLEQLIAVIGVPGKTDLSRIGNSLATENNKGGLNSLGDAVDLFDFTNNIANIIEGISDL